LDPFIDSGFDIESEVAQADPVHEVTADVTWHECYDGVVVQNDDQFDLFENLKPGYSNDDLLFAEIIDDLAISGFEEEKDDFTSISPSNLPSETCNPCQDMIYHPSIFASEESDSDPHILFTDFNLSEPTMAFSIGGPKPVESSTSAPPLNRHLSFTTKQQSPSSQLIPHATSPRYPPKPVRQRDQSQQKWKDKRAETLSEARALDARQIATSKRERSNGKFAKRKINWVSITEMV
jgi:hypothetical protein